MKPLRVTMSSRAAPASLTAALFSRKMIPLGLAKVLRNALASVSPRRVASVCRAAAFARNTSPSAEHKKLSALSFSINAAIVDIAVSFWMRKLRAAALTATPNPKSARAAALNPSWIMVPGANTAIRPNTTAAPSTAFARSPLARATRESLL